MIRQVVVMSWASQSFGPGQKTTHEVAMSGPKTWRKLLHDGMIALLFQKSLSERQDSTPSSPVASMYLKMDPFSLSSNDLLLSKRRPSILRGGSWLAARGSRLAARGSRHHYTEPCFHAFCLPHTVQAPFVGVRRKQPSCMRRDPTLAAAPTQQKKWVASSPLTLWEVEGKFSSKLMASCKIV